MSILISLVLGILFLLTVSREWHIIWIILFVLVWRSNLHMSQSSCWEWGYVALSGVLVTLFIASLPRYFALPTDRVRHYYIGKNGKIKLPPVHHWVLNALLPEEELCNIGIKAAKIAGSMVGIGSSLMENLDTERRKGSLKRMLNPYKRLINDFENPMSAAFVQGLNQFLGENKKSFYLIRPKHYNKDKEYPLVVFCHGYMGNWKLYNGVLKDLENCIVLSIGTHDISGIFFDDEIYEIDSLYIPAIERMGYKINKENVSIMGLSNGGSAVNEAYRHFSQRFKNIVYISTPLLHTYPVHSKIVVVGGAADPSGVGMQQGYDAIRRNGGKISIYWSENGTHFIFATEQDEITEFLNKELCLN